MIQKRNLAVASFDTDDRAALEHARDLLNQMHNALNEDADVASYISHADLERLLDLYYDLDELLDEANELDADAINEWTANNED